MAVKGKFQFAIDRGGTFTDVWARCPGGEIRVLKLLSEDPQNYPDAPREGIRRILEQETGVSFPPLKPLDASLIDWIRMGTTVATNALLERKGERMALVITKGFQDLLHIGNQSRPNIFDLEIVTADVLYEDIIEVEERVVLKQASCEIQRSCDFVTGVTGEQLEVWQPVNEEKLRTDLQRIVKKGIRSVAVVLMHSYTLTDADPVIAWKTGKTVLFYQHNAPVLNYNGHEKVVERVAREVGLTHVSLSSEVMPMVRIVPRGYTELDCYGDVVFVLTASADAFLTPCIQKYVQGFSSGFQDHLEETRALFMQSDGGLTPMQKFNGSRAILSGPAGGVVGYAQTTYGKVTDLPVIGFDMGGTSTDVSRYAGEFEHVFETTTAGITIQAPQLDINTVAAGGGSMLFFRAGMFVVGPESAGAHPGPVCYQKGGPLTVTDANLCLGRILPHHFPHIFGPTEDQPLDKDLTLTTFRKLTEQVNGFLASQSEGTRKEPMSVEEVAMGFIQVANETMCRPIRALTQAKGHDTSRHVLSCFGGAGGQHACAIARSLGMTQVFIHKYAGILSAYGMAQADVVHEAQEPCAKVYQTENLHYIDTRIAKLEQECVEELIKQGFKRKEIQTTPFLHLRYDKTDCALMVTATDQPPDGSTSNYGNFQAAFLMRYQREFGFTIPDRPIRIDDIRVRGLGKSNVESSVEIESATGPPPVKEVVTCYFESGKLDTPVYLLERLRADHSIEGPAIIIDKNSTILVEPTCVAAITKERDVLITIGSCEVRQIGTELDAIQLSIFSHRFMSTAEQMGRVLQRTSISTNIKERLDFSCAVFGPDGGLVANAPHIPVHLGAMQETVQYQMKVLGKSFREVILSNHPRTGGSHLPDLTVITPVFHESSNTAVFYVASRGHHADIGGITPGSMPANSKTIYEEGAVFKSFKLVIDGIFQEEAVTEALMEPGKFPGSSGTRNLHDNLSDLRAQVAANQKGVHLIQGLIMEYGLDVVQAYMAHIQNNAEVAVREMLKEIAQKTRERTGKTLLHAEDAMDDGSKIILSVDIDENQGTAVIDFTGTSYETHGNLNAPRAVTLSALIYCLRSMVGHDVPLNQGCLKPVTVIVPEGTLLNPSENAAVVGGNILTSQRVTDVIFKAFSTCAASQGCMNNTTFGDEEGGYYETVAGGAGAGPTWHGRSGVHTHMTNTRITDPEILERRYPVVLRRFELNPGTGGKGRYHGGDGVVREMLFRKPLTLSVLSERRVFQPYGMQGGAPGRSGLNLLYHKDGRIINLGAKASIHVETGDCFRLESPGGGGWGEFKGDNNDEENSNSKKSHQHANTYTQKGSLYSYKLAQESA